MKYLNCYSKNDISIDDVAIPCIDENEVLVRTIFCGLCITDVLKVIDEAVKKPARLGHEVVGVLEKVGGKVKNYKIGDLVALYHRIPCFECNYCLHKKYSMCKHARETNFDPQGFSEFIRLSKEHVQHDIFLINDKNNLKNAVFTEPVATCIRAIANMPLLKKDKVMVVGCGTMGNIMLKLLNYYGINALAVDIDDNKLKFAEVFCRARILNPKSSGFKEKIKIFAPDGLDAVILTVTNSEIIEMAMSFLREGGFIQIFAGPLNEKRIEIDFDRLYKKEICIFSSYSSYPEVNRQSFNLLMRSKRNNLDFTPLISHVLPIERFKDGIDLALSQKYFKILFYMNEQLLKTYFNKDLIL
jgi:L-iditol 2-dehydrogenase